MRHPSVSFCRVSPTYGHPSLDRWKALESLDIIVARPTRGADEKILIKSGFFHGREMDFGTKNE